MTPHRCAWAGSDPLMQAYHDEEWGVPERDPRALWEKLSSTASRPASPGSPSCASARACAPPSPASTRTPWPASARPTSPASSPTPASSARAPRSTPRSAAPASTSTWPTRGEDFAAWAWSFTDGETLRGDGLTVPASTDLSERISKDLKRRGFKFVGPTIVYAWMQAVGIVNDHAADCFRRDAARGSPG